MQGGSSESKGVRATGREEEEEEEVDKADKEVGSTPCGVARSKVGEVWKREGATDQQQ